MMRKLKFLKVLNSPFRPFKLKWYFGKTQIGTPYFYPRRWVKATPKLAHEAVLKHIEREENYNKHNPNYAREIKSYDELYKEYLRYEFPVPKRIGFDLVELGWKTKWEDTDYRFEWSPLISFVFFGYQLAVMVIAPETSNYWEAWLYYENDTDHKLSKRERIELCKKEFPMRSTVYHGDGRKEEVEYYSRVLRKKYL